MDMRDTSSGSTEAVEMTGIGAPPEAPASAGESLGGAPTNGITTKMTVASAVPAKKDRNIEGSPQNLCVSDPPDRTFITLESLLGSAKCF
ncbi:hypothetical protein [Microcella alkaliphila]|uniref:hypothetical protein n=1 Tax=Microcella alkaliphila TaxID=279828 RepID=UPI0010293406|nr:hypothetical protein [Microcella alkaliphila]